MASPSVVSRTIVRTRALPLWAKYLAAGGAVAAVLPLSLAFRSALPPGYPFLPFFFSILVAGSLFNQGSGFVAAALSALAATWFFLAPVGALAAESHEDRVALLLFLAVGFSTAGVVEAMHRALVREERARADLARSEGQRRLLLNEFRHRTRNDLQSLSALLLLRARVAPSPAAADGLREAAGHARALARVHAWLALGDANAADGSDPARVDTKSFVEGLCQDLHRAQSGGELRPVALVADAEAHALDTERAVHLGLVLNELVTNALKYAFPDNAAGSVRVRFLRRGDEFVLSVRDDGVGLPEEDTALERERARGTGLGTRLLQGLAAQLRGAMSRGRGANGVGTEVELRFPAAEPRPVPV